MEKFINVLKKDLIYVFLLFLLFLYYLYRILDNIQDQKLLKHSKEIVAIVVKTYQSGYKSSAYSKFKYTVSEKEYEFSQTGGYYKYLKPGDTVLIEYAIKDNSEARVVNSRYMQKFN